MKSAVLFDLDGTLTVPYLDFDAIRAELGLPPGPILEAMARMEPVERARAEQVLDRHERDAAEHSTLQPGAARTVAGLRRHGWRVGVLTRNTRHWTRYVLAKHGVEVDGLRCRDDGAVKPAAEPVLELCAELRADPRTSWVVGDHLFDILAGAAAGARTILLIGDGAPPEYAHRANHVVTTLDAVSGLIDSPASERTTDVDA